MAVRPESKQIWIITVGPGSLIFGSRSPAMSPETYFSSLGPESFRSRRLQVSILWILQRKFANCKVKKNFWNLTIFCMLHLQVRNNENKSEKCHKFEQNSTRKSWYLRKIRLNEQIIVTSRSRISSLDLMSCWWSLGLEGHGLDYITPGLVGSEERCHRLTFLWPGPTLTLHKIQ